MSQRYVPNYTESPYQAGDIVIGPDGSRNLVTELILFDDGSLCYYKIKDISTLFLVLEGFK